ncbi:Aldo/keto reductase [Cordyceps fumosorosea ARSEF 2679]|uniref:Aldo/keto reductase n=1 Tax=Cordyceps fumosorosea (strain ARSEF 2679) TaxID=1081104 RepID=A0A162I4B7_CORFA|nr:Aldo/keto reductase [Cordyceps fumosorosea ARSEF 2679]OAA52125.1 Aldo/keto reductase [Cordyceps fumosorosea ARSEF 2679]
MSLPTRQLGRDGPPVTSIGLGLMSFSGWYAQGATSAAAAHALLDRAHALGERFWDTADVYAGSEALVGGWFRQNPEKRGDVFLATKFALRHTAEGERVVDTSPEYVKKACEKSLETLGVDVIDLYYVHRVDEKTPIEHTIKAMAELKAEGKIRYLGLSECSAATIRRAHAVHPITAYQVEYSPLFLDIESPRTSILSTCRELGIAVVAYSPVARGLLTGAVKSHADLLSAGDFRAAVPKFSADNFPRITALVGRIEEIGARHGATPAQVCLAWVAAQGEDVISIPGTSKVRYLEENVKALEVQLSEEEVAELRKYAEATELPGDRYPAAFGSMFRDSVPL